MRSAFVPAFEQMPIPEQMPASSNAERRGLKGAHARAVQERLSELHEVVVKILEADADTAAELAQSPNTQAAVADVRALAVDKQGLEKACVPSV